MYSAILLAAGVGRRTCINLHKALIPISGYPLWRYSCDVFLADSECAEVIVVVHQGDIEAFQSQIKEGERIKVITGGSTRFASSKLGVEAAREEVVLVHDAARPDINLTILNNIYKQAQRIPCYLARTLSSLIRNYRSEENSESLLEVLTPQGFKKELYLNFVSNLDSSIKEESIRDEMMVFRASKFPVMPIITSEEVYKVTTRQDVRKAEQMLLGETRIGSAYDMHKLVYGRSLILGGVPIESLKGPEAVSDGDVVYHVIAEAIISALRMGDLGTLFPESDERNKNRSSSDFVSITNNLLKNKGGNIQSLEIDVFLEETMLLPYRERMINNIAHLLDISRDIINFKAHHGEGLGAVGRGEAIEAKALMMVKMRKEII